MDSSRKHYFAFLFALPALLLLLLLKGIPLITALMLPFKNFSIMKGIIGSPWVGGANFQKLFSSPNFCKTLMNTLYINAGFILVVLVTSLILGVSLSYIRNTKLFMVFCAIFILPFFIPQIYWSMLFVKLFSAQGLIQGFSAEPHLYLADGRLVRFLYIMVEVIRWTGILAAFIAVAIQKAPRQERAMAALKAVFSIFLVSIAFILITDFELLHTLVNPLVYEYADTLSLFKFRTGIMLNDINAGASLWLLEFLYSFVVLTLLALFAGGFIKKSLLPLSNPVIIDNQTERTNSSIAAIIINAVYALFLLIILALMAYVLLDVGKWVQTDLFVKNSIVYIMLAFVSSAAGIFLTILLAYPLTTYTPVVRKVYAIFIIVFLAASQFGIHELFFIKKLGILDTYFAIILTSTFSPASVIILGAFYNQRSADTPASFIQYVKTSLPAIICLFVAAFLLNTNSYTSSLLYMNSIERQAPSVQLYMGINGMK